MKYIYRSKLNNPRPSRWMRGQAGRKNRNRRPFDCRKSFAAFEVGMDAVEGVFTYIDDYNVIDGHCMYLVGGGASRQPRLPRLSWTLPRRAGAPLELARYCASALRLRLPREVDLDPRSLISFRSLTLRQTGVFASSERIGFSI